MSAVLLDQRLRSDSRHVATGPLSELRLIDDARFPWLVLVPQVADAVEWIDLDQAQQAKLSREMSDAGRALRTTWPCEKLNIAALGNVVRQLHLHVVARSPGDAAWPGPVWGHGVMERMSRVELASRIAALRGVLDAGLWRWEPEAT